MSFSVIDPVTLAQKLIGCPSVTPEDKGAQQILIGILEEAGFTCTKLPFGNVKNFYARRGTDGPHLCFCGHTDVVPPGDEQSWRYPPFAGHIDKDILYGRGAVDMKGNIACFIAALSRYLAAHPEKDKGSVSLLITGDEEGPAIDGTAKVLQWMADNHEIPDAALVGEPSNPSVIGDEIKIGRRGSLTGKITVTGRQGHVAYPHLADNPLPHLIKLLAALDGYSFDDGSEFFQPTNLEITTIDTGNAADNVIPQSVMARFNIRFNDHWTAATLEDKIRALLDHTGEHYDLSTWSNAESFITQPGPFTELVSHAVYEMTGMAPALSTGGGTSDARFVSRYCPVVEFGLVNQTIHQTNEHVPLSDLSLLTDIYTKILARFFENGANI